MSKHVLRNTWHIISRNYHKFETDPVTQLRYHRRMTIFWICNFPAITILLYFNIEAIFSGHDTKLALLLDAVTLGINTYYSLYANLDTEIGDAHGAYASLRADQIKENKTIDKEALPPAIF